MLRDDDETLSLCSAGPGGASTGVALCAALDMAAATGAPEWVHLLPAGEIRTADGRGPYRVVDPAALVAASLTDGDRLPIDENHATDLAAPRGEPAPARGWIVGLQARADGIWGRVEWTALGRRLVAGRAYRGLSPAIRHSKTGEVSAILRASLVNRPNLRGLTALHQEQENDMDLKAQIAQLLGLPGATTDADIVAKITTLHAGKGKDGTALQAALDPIAQLVGLQAGADAAAILAGVRELAADDGDEGVVTALQAELVEVTTKLNGLLDSGKRDKATAFVDGAIREGRVGVKPQRDRYVTMHMADPDNTKALIEALPILGGGGQIVPATPPARDGEVSLNAAQMTVARMLGQDAKAYAETLKAEREAETAL